MTRDNPVLAQAVGSVALSFARVDALAFMILRNFVSDLDHQLVLAVLRSDRASATAEALLDISKSTHLDALGRDLRDELRAIALEYKALTPRRNNVIHGLVSESETGMTLLNARDVTRSAPTSVPELLALAEELHHFEDRLSVFGSAYVARAYPDEHETHPGWHTVARAPRGGTGTLRRWVGKPES